MLLKAVYKAFLGTVNWAFFMLAPSSQVAIGEMLLSRFIEVFYLLMDSHLPNGTVTT